MQNLSSWQEYFKSSVITFVAVFATAVLPQLGDAPMTKASLVALAMVGIRAGVKALLEILAGMKTSTNI